MNAAPPISTRRPKTSIDILLERDALAAEVDALRGTLAAIAAEAQHALHHPQISLTTLCRIEALVRALDAEPPVAQSA